MIAGRTKGAWQIRRQQEDMGLFHFYSLCTTCCWPAAESLKHWTSNTTASINSFGGKSIIGLKQTIISVLCNQLNQLSKSFIFARISEVVMDGKFSNTILWFVYKVDVNLMWRKPNSRGGVKFGVRSQHLPTEWNLIDVAFKLKRRWKYKKHKGQFGFKLFKKLG
jgi:hypothetical protein